MWHIIFSGAVALVAIYCILIITAKTVEVLESMKDGKERGE